MRCCCWSPSVTPPNICPFAHSSHSCSVARMHSHQPCPACAASPPGHPPSDLFFSIVAAEAAFLFFLLFFSLAKMHVVMPSFQPMRPLLHALLHVTSMPATAPPPPSTASPASAPVMSFDVAETASPAPMLQPPSSSWGSTDLPLYTQVSPSVFPLALTS